MTNDGRKHMTEEPTQDQIDLAIARGVIESLTLDIQILREQQLAIAQRLVRLTPASALIATLTSEVEAIARADGDPSAQIVYGAVRGQLSRRSADVRDLLGNLKDVTPEAVVNRQIELLYQAARYAGRDWEPTIEEGN